MSQLRCESQKTLAVSWSGWIFVFGIIRIEDNCEPTVLQRWKWGEEQFLCFIRDIITGIGIFIYSDINVHTSEWYQQSPLTPLSLNNDLCVYSSFHCFSALLCVLNSITNDFGTVRNPLNAPWDIDPIVSCKSRTAVCEGADPGREGKTGLCLWAGFFMRPPGNWTPREQRVNQVYSKIYVSYPPMSHSSATPVSSVWTNISSRRWAWAGSPSSKNPTVPRQNLVFHSCIIAVGFIDAAGSFWVSLDEGV